jgi:uncharacterized protein (TIGR03435 family)
MRPGVSCRIAVMKSIAGLGILAFACFAAHGQTQDGQPSFEVASVKPSTPPEAGARRRVGCNGGPGRGDPGLFTCTNMSSANLVTMAYDIPHYQFSGPDWMNDTRFDITAKVPPGTTGEQLRLMQQRLLVERFKLTVHYEKTEMQTYDLTVGKNGPKLKESVGSETPLTEPPKRIMGSDGLPVFPPNVSMMVMMNGRARMQQIGETMERFAGFLAGQLSRPVTDSTGLKGKYDILLTWASDGAGMAPAAASDVGTPASTPEPLPTLMQAVQGLGLKLEQKKGAVDMLVIDHMEKTPTEN